MLGAVLTEDGRADELSLPRLDHGLRMLQAVLLVRGRASAGVDDGDYEAANEGGKQVGDLISRGIYSDTHILCLMYGAEILLWKIKYSEEMRRAAQLLLSSDSGSATAAAAAAAEEPVVPGDSSRGDGAASSPDFFLMSKVPSAKHDILNMLESLVGVYVDIVTNVIPGSGWTVDKPQSVLAEAIEVARVNK